MVPFEFLKSVLRHGRCVPRWPRRELEERKKSATGARGVHSLIEEVAKLFDQQITLLDKVLPTPVIALENDPPHKHTQTMMCGAVATPPSLYIQVRPHPVRCSRYVVAF